MAANAKTKKYLQSELYNEIKEDLLDQLDRNGTTGKYNKVRNLEMGIGKPSGLQ